MLAGLPRFISTSETAKHRVFTFIDAAVLPEHKLVNIAHSDPSMLAALSSSVHIAWSLPCGSRLEDRPVYVKTTCFETFPFPGLEEGPLKQRIRDLGERLDAHRKRQQELHPDLTLTGLYNVLEAVRAGRPLNAKEKAIHEKGLVSILKQLHDDLDSAVLEAYGWTDLQTAAPQADRLAAKDAGAEALEQAILSRLVALNHERAEEEKRGLIRWLRPDYQAPHAAALPAEEQKEIQVTAGTSAAKAANIPDKLPWPDGLAAQVAAIQKLIPALGSDPEAIAARLGKKSPKRSQQVAEILETLKSLGQL